MTYLLGVVVLLLAAGLVVLFAMMGELYARLNPDQVRRPGGVRIITQVPVGVAPSSWPEGIAPLAGADLGVAIVLSTVCASCTDVARQLRDEPASAAAGTLGVVVSTSDAEHGVQFVREHGLDRLPLHIDEGGVWVAGEFDVRSSPTALVFRRGSLVSALAFADIGALRLAVFGETPADSGIPTASRS